jgi:DNA-directed RNA polymerase specialized sigma24 family protein
MREHRERMRDMRDWVDADATVPGNKGLATRTRSEWQRSDDRRSATDVLTEACRLARNESRSPEAAKRVLRLHWCVDIDREFQAVRRLRQERVTRTYTPGQRKEAVRLYQETSLSVAEIASHLDLPRRTVQSWIRRDTNAA